MQRTALGEAPVGEPAGSLMRSLEARVLDTRGLPLGEVPLVAVFRDSDAEPVSLGLSDRNGVLSLALPEAACELQAGAGYFTLYAAEISPASSEGQELFLVAAPKVRIEGQVLREDGSPLEGVSVFFEWWNMASFPGELDRVRAMSLPSTKTLADGSFSLAACPGTEQLSVHFQLDGYRRESLPGAAHDRRNVSLVLKLHDAASENFRVRVAAARGASEDGRGRALPLG